MMKVLLLCLAACYAAAFSPVAPARAAGVASRSDAVVMAAKKKGVNPALFATGIAPKSKGPAGKRIAGFGPLYVERPRHGVSALTYLLSTGVATAGIYRGRANGVSRGDMEHGLAGRVDEHAVRDAGAVVQATIRGSFRGLGRRLVHAHALEPQLVSVDHVRAARNWAESNDVAGWPVHLKLDTGMHRLGLAEEAQQAVDVFGSQSAVSQLEDNKARAEAPSSSQP